MMSRTLLVIPHYNDTERLRPFLIELQRTLPGHFSIQVSDDGSSEKQRKALLSLVNELDLVTEKGVEIMPPLFTDKNTGKGGAVYRGWETSSGYSLLAFADADGAVNATEIIRAESYMRSLECTADALFASRVKMLGRSIERSFLRHLSGRIFATLVSELGNIPAYDTQCGLKILTAEAYQKIQTHLYTHGFAFDVELALLLIKTGSKIIEFPIDWNDLPGSKVSLLRDSVKMTIDVIRIKSRINI